MIHKTKLIVCLIISFISMTYLISSSMASQQRLINFQGRLTDAQGNVLDGTYNIIFSIYSSADDTNTLWTEMHKGGSVSEGLVNVLLGSVEPFGTNLMFDQGQYSPYYLGITIDTDGNINTKEPEMLPRQQIMPASYAWNADKLDGKDGNEYTIPETDAGRYRGVVDTLYEGEMALEEKYMSKKEYSCEDGYYIQKINKDGTVICKKDVNTDNNTQLSKATVQQWAREVEVDRFSQLKFCTVWGATSGYVAMLVPNTWDINDCRGWCIRFNEYKNYQWGTMNPSGGWNIQTTTNCR